MNNKFKKEDADRAGKVLKNLGASAKEATQSIGKMAKQLNRAKHYKAVICASDMKSTTIYKGVSDDKLYRRPINGKIERMEGNKWVEVKVNYEFLNNEKFREY